jgi:hypothetical protein
VLEMARDAPFAGHKAFNATRHYTRLSFWFPHIAERIKSCCSICSVSCVRQSRFWNDKRVSLITILRNDELLFTHLMMDCIGSILPEGGRTLKT